MIQFKHRPYVGDFNPHDLDALLFQLAFPMLIVAKDGDTATIRDIPNDRRQDD